MEGQGEGQCGAGGELEIFFISEGDGIGCVSKLHGKNILKHIKDSPISSSDCITFTLL